jgi:hypothetical protein
VPERMAAMIIKQWLVVSEKQKQKQKQRLGLQDESLIFF